MLSDDFVDVGYRTGWTHYTDNEIRNIFNNIEDKSRAVEIIAGFMATTLDVARRRMIAMGLITSKGKPICKKRKLEPTYKREDK